MLFDLNPFSLCRRINRPLILDGAMGSLLQQKGFKADTNIWMTSVNITSPEAIVEIHKAYIEAGADIITTNTFRTNPSSLEASGISNPSSFVRQAVQLARLSVGELPLFVAGSNAPVEDCYQRERKVSYNKLEVNHKYHIDLLIENGVHFILNETQSHFDEIGIICQHCRKNEIPYILSVFLDNNLKILSGEPMWDIIKFVLDHEPLAIGFNCIAPSVFVDVLNQARLDLNWGFYLNCGKGQHTDEKLICAVSPQEYSKIVADSLRYSPAFIGACCGSDPSHIKEVKKLLDGKAD